jgi:hypothetical protein
MSAIFALLPNDGARIKFEPLRRKDAKEIIGCHREPAGRINPGFTVGLDCFASLAMTMVILEYCFRAQPARPKS